MPSVHRKYSRILSGKGGSVVAAPVKRSIRRGDEPPAVINQILLPSSVPSHRLPRQYVPETRQVVLEKIDRNYVIGG